jgi:hypothetical protein
VKIKAGLALFYSYIRKTKGTAHSVVVVPGRSQSYVLNAVVPAGENQIARQVGAMIRSFDF